jgi:hypothetical protein
MTSVNDNLSDFIAERLAETLSDRKARIVPQHSHGVARAVARIVGSVIACCAASIAISIIGLQLVAGVDIMEALTKSVPASLNAFETDPAYNAAVERDSSPRRLTPTLAHRDS